MELRHVYDTEIFRNVKKNFRQGVFPGARVQKIAQLLASRRMAELAQRLGFDLADALARHIEFLADLFERMRFGLIDGKPHTLEEVGKEFDVTRERIRQIESKALRKLRHPSRSKKLRDFLNSSTRKDVLPKIFLDIAENFRIIDMS